VARKKAEDKNGNNGSGADLGFKQKLRAADEMRSYTDPAEHRYVVFGLELKGSGYEA
jgi:hypothetical protein